MKSTYSPLPSTRFLRAAVAALLVVLFTQVTLLAGVIPHLISHQGRVVVNGANFTGTGLFTFSIRNTAGTHWTSGQQSIPVSNGLYTALLGQAPMPPIPIDVFENTDLMLRIEFDDQVNGPQTLSPDQPLTAAGYAFVAEQLCLPFEPPFNSPDRAMDLVNEGLGGVLSLEIDNPASSADVLSIFSNATGPAMNCQMNAPSGNAAIIRTQNAANPDHTLDVQSNGSGTAFRAFSEGTGAAADIQISSASNTQPALNVSTNGTGRAISASAANLANGTPGNAVNFTGTVLVQTNTHNTAGSDPTLGVFTIDDALNDGICLAVETDGSGTALNVDSGTGPAANFNGGVQINGILDVNQMFNANSGARVDGNLHVTGTLSKSNGTFRIDHPLDPENKYLYHSFVESPDMMNVYNGNVVTDANGDATVELPDYFDALNRDFRYQLTVLGDRFAMARVSEKIRNRQFSIKTNEPGIEVSWQVTGIRKDAWANDHPIEVEAEKPASEKGSYYGMNVLKP